MLARLPQGGDGGPIASFVALLVAPNLAASLNQAGDDDRKPYDDLMDHAVRHDMIIARHPSGERVPKIAKELGE